MDFLTIDANRRKGGEGKEGEEAPGEEKQDEGNSLVFSYRISMELWFLLNLICICMNN